jgi:hypothetical protein
MTRSLFLNIHLNRGIIGAYHITLAGNLFPERSPSEASPKKPGVDGDATPGMYAIDEHLHGPAALAVAHAVNAAFCFATDVDVFLACSTIGFALDNLYHRKSSYQRSSVHDSGFTFGASAFRGFLKGAFGPFFVASLPSGLVSDFLASFLGTTSVMATIGDDCLAGRE